MAGTTTDLNALKERLATTWKTGDYQRIAEGLVRDAEAFVDRVAPARGERLLDVACGAGQMALPAARAGARVTGVDIADGLIARARERAASEGLDARFEVADAEELPFGDDSFDTCVTLIGAMFAPRPEHVAAELVRVTRPGGRIVMGNWTPGSFVGEMFRTVAGHTAPPDFPSPLLWGDESTVEERFGDCVSRLDFERRPYELHYPVSPAGVVALFREQYGPFVKALETLDGDGRAALLDDLTRLWDRHNRADDGTTRVVSEILEVTAVPR